MKIALRHRALGLVLGIWSYPYAVLGLVLALVLLAFRQAEEPKYGQHPALDAVRVPPWLPFGVVVVHGRLAAAMKRRGWGALALGWVVFCWGPPSTARLVRHEVRHVEQVAVLGPLFPLVYLGLLLFGLVGAAILVLGARNAIGKPARVLLREIARAAYVDHPLERDARRAAERGRSPEQMAP